MTKYYFTRHGESQANVDRIFAGAAESPLTETGRLGAQAEGERLAREGQVFDLILSSPLSRAVDTAKLIAAALEYPTENIVIEPLLHERDFGSLVGKSWDIVSDESSEMIVEAGGESVDQLAERVRLSLQNVRALADGKDSVLIVGHGTWYQMAVALLRGKEPTSFLEVHGIANNKVVELEL